MNNPSQPDNSQQNKKEGKDLSLILADTESVKKETLIQQTGSTGSADNTPLSQRIKELEGDISKRNRENLETPRKWTEEGILNLHRRILNIQEGAELQKSEMLEKIKEFREGYADILIMIGRPYYTAEEIINKGRELLLKIDKELIKELENKE